MLYGFLVTLYVFVCILLVLIILIQKGKGSMGLGGLGGSTQMLFGGSGGQDIFQKITWVLATVFVFGSLTLALMKSTQRNTSRYIKPIAQPVMPMPTTTQPLPSTESVPQNPQ
jgi:preprotein translocase subunit SecG